MVRLEETKEPDSLECSVGGTFSKDIDEVTVDLQNGESYVRIPLKVYEELIEYKGRYLELKSHPQCIPYYPYPRGTTQPFFDSYPYKITCHYNSELLRDLENDRG